MIKKNNLILLYALCLLISMAIFGASYALRMERMRHLLQPELIATTLFLLFFIGFMLLNVQLISQTNIPADGTDSGGKPIVDPKTNKTLHQTGYELQIKDLNLLLTTEKERVAQLEKLLQTFENQRDAFQKEKERVVQLENSLQEVEKQREALSEKVNANTHYLQQLNRRYKDLLDLAGATDDRKPNAPEIVNVWRVLIALGLHQYDYMKIMSEPENCRAEQNANIRMVREGIFVDALDPAEYCLYTDTKETDWRYKILRRRLQQVGIETLNDVLISGVRI